MKRLRFRVYDKATHKMWIVGSNPHDCLDFDIKNNVIYRNYQTGETSKSDYVLMPYTGFEDENGNEIYIGDIVRYGGYLYEVIEELSTPNLIRLDKDYIDYDDFGKSIYGYDGKLKWCGQENDCIVSLYDIACNKNDVDECLDCQIVGNIYENGKLDYE